MEHETLLDLYKSHRGKVSDKWHHYLVEYEKLLADYQNTEVRLLEIGVQNGGSLEIWARYFKKAKAILGCDIDPKCGLLEFDDRRISVVVGDANAGETQDRIQEISPEFDIVIDDGSHASGDIIKSFAHYFPLVSDGGIYIVEDLHCSYWHEYEGGLYHPRSSLSFLKSLTDIINLEHWGLEKGSKDVLAGFIEAYGIDLDESVLRQIHSIEFANSTCTIRKLPAEENLLGNRNIAGEEISVATVPQTLSASIQPQISNFWSARKHPPGEELTIRLQELADQAEQIQKLEHETRKNALEFTRLKEQLENHSNELGHIHRSWSWRLTTPLRRIWKLRNFDEKYYLEQNSDVAQSGVDPFTHYQLFGRMEGRLPKHPSSSGPLKSKIHVIKQSIDAEGGFIASFRSMVSVLKTEGIKGVKERLDMIFLQTSRNNYSKWIEQFDTLTEKDRSQIRNTLAGMEEKPLISILMPTYNTHIAWLEEAIDSVRNQLYENWELCIADDASTNEELLKFLEAITEKDERIRVTFRKENGHISAASNSALEVCSGQWVALMDHDDILAEHALFHVALTIHRNPDAQLIYSDEDKISEKGFRSDPYFKCDWNPDLFYSHNLISHLGVYRRDIMTSINGFREGFEGSQDHDLALRYIERIDQKNIHHIPRVLYHWRKHEESTSSSKQAKPYAVIAGETAIQEHFDRIGIEARVEGSHSGYRVRYSLPRAAPLVTLIIPTRNGLQLLKNCISSIEEKTSYENYEILVVDNGSDQPEILEYFSELDTKSNVHVYRDDRPFNFAQINNTAVKKANGEFVALVNNDIEVITPEWLTEMIAIACQPGVGAVGAKLLYPDGTVQHAGVALGIGGVGNHAFKDQPGNSPGYFGRAQVISSYSAVTAACLVIRRDIFMEVNGLDEDNLAIAFNDVDFCLRVREAGYRNVWTPYSVLFHHESASRGYEDTDEKYDRFVKEVKFMQNRWGQQLFEDPAYSPNLTLEHTDFSFAWPPRVPRPGSIRH